MFQLTVRRMPFVLAALFLALFLVGCTVTDMPSGTPQQTQETSAKPSPVSVSPTATTFQSPSLTDSDLSVSAAPSYTVADFLPLADIYLRYRSKLSNSVQNVYTEFLDSETHSVQRKILSKDGPVMEILQCRNGQLIRTHRLTGIGYTYNFIGTKSNQDEVLLQDPIAVGTAWQIRDGKRQISSINKTVPVPIGAFTCVEVTTNYDDGRRSLQYYMRSVGLLAQYDLDENGLLQDIYEVSFREKNDGFPQKIRFYFANPEQKTIVGVMREIVISPDTDLRLRFAAELRNVTGASGLIPLSPNVRINRIAPDGKGGVSVDFSRQLITEMDLGEDGETLLLRALAKTFASYYQAKRVYLTIEGGPYVSDYRKIRVGSPLPMPE